MVHIINFKLAIDMEKYDYLIVGSGLYGATFAYKAKTERKKMLGYRQAFSLWWKCLFVIILKG